MSELTGTYEDEIEASLKPCPRCNGKALIENFDEILCDSCGLWSGDDWPSLDEAVEWWNKQPHIEALKQRIAELEAQLAGAKAWESWHKHSGEVGNSAIASQAQRIQELQAEVSDLQASFDLRHDSDMRAIKQWQEATGEELKWPNHADLCVWLMQRIAELEAQAAREPIPQSLEYDLITYAIKHGELPQGYSLFRRKEAGE